jgi:3-hydroxyacyl-[acyl-carrier-protein] dehydratase
VTTGQPMRTMLEVPRDHPAYAGHFPGNPILPAVAILAEVLAAIERAGGGGPERWQVQGAKFLAPVAPGDALALVHDAPGAGALRFEVFGPGERVVASGTLVPAP